jgi:hypothetical protein
MKKIRQSIIVISLVFMMLLPAVAQADKINLAAYQDLMIRYSMLIGADDATAQLQALTREQWQHLYDLTPSKNEFAKAITDLENLAQGSAEKRGTPEERWITPRVIDPNVTVEGEFEPRYPDVDPNSDFCITSAAGCYGNYILIPSLLGFFAPDSGEPGIQDNRCNEHAEAIERENHRNLHELAIAAQAACDTAGAAPLVQVIACPAAGTAWLLDNASQELLTACEVHTGNVDSAEIEAAYENSRTVLYELGDETKFTDDGELATHESNIKGAISAHDAEIKEQLTLIQDQLTQQQAKLDKIIKLLNTPQGKRPNWNK